MLYAVSFANSLKDTQRRDLVDLLNTCKTTEDVYEARNFLLVSTTVDHASSLGDLINPMEDEYAPKHDCIITPVTSDFAAYMDNDAWIFIGRYREKESSSKKPVKTDDDTSDKDKINFSSTIRRDGRKIEELTLTPETAEVVSRFLDGANFRREAAAVGYKLKEGFQNILISGSPGVGKTTLAKALARAYLAEQKSTTERPVLLIKPDDVIARYSGQSLNNLKQAFERAKDGVLILDEIDSYERIPSFGMDVINGLNVHIGNNPNAPVIIGTLYESRVNALFGNNTGLKSRFRHHIQIAAQDNALLSTILMNELSETGIKIHPEVKRQVLSVIEAHKKSAGANFGYIRDVENIRDFILDSLARRFSAQRTDIRSIEITVNDLPTRDFKGTLVSYGTDRTVPQQETASVVTLPVRNP